MSINKRIPEENPEELVPTGCISTGVANGSLITTPLGSCVALVAYDPTTKTGGIAHIMLPGTTSDENAVESCKFAGNAIECLMHQFVDMGADESKLRICLAGGANVLREKNKNVGAEVIESVFEHLAKRNLTSVTSSLGGYERRTARLNLDSGIVIITVGEGTERILCTLTE